MGAYGMQHDRYGNPLTTGSQKARDLYVDGLDRFLAADGGVAEAFAAAIEADDAFSIGHLSQARFLQVKGDRQGALGALQQARATSEGISEREASLVSAFSPLIEGRPAEALKAIRAHLSGFPRDALAMQACTTVFGLIGFSGLPGREAELLAFTSSFTPHYGDDWWFLSQHAFSQVEVGQIEQARANIERSFELNPRSAQMAHVRAHVFYEGGEPDAGYDFLTGWRKGYDRSGLLHGHISWHLALWALDRGNTDLMWKTINEDVSPGAALGPPLVVLCDTAAILYRASLRGIEIPPERWQSISEFASRYFPETGIAFGDVHAAIAHAMAGNGSALSRIVSKAQGPAGEVVREVGEAFRSIIAENWTEALDHLTKVMSDHARIGGSRAQRDLIEFTLCNVLLKLGKGEQAKWLLSMRRPCIAH